MFVLNLPFAPSSEMFPVEVVDSIPLSRGMDCLITLSGGEEEAIGF